MKTVKLCRRLWAIAVLLASVQPAFALITVSTDDRPVENLGWPLGCEAVANRLGRVAWIEGPAFGGGQCEFLFRCENAAQFNDALKTFAAIVAPRLELVVHDGPEYSVHLEGYQDAQPQARIDWRFTVWKPESWHRLHSNPLNAGLMDTNSWEPVPPPRVAVYIGEGSIVWKDVMVPENVAAIDERAESAPVKPQGGGLLHAQVFDMATGQPVATAQVAVARFNAEKRRWDNALTGRTDERGVVEIGKIPPDNYRIYVRAPGYASRMLGYFNNRRGNRYYEFIGELVHTSALRGVVVDGDGQPMANVAVSSRWQLGINGRTYEPEAPAAATTGPAGRFEIGQVGRGYTVLLGSGPGLYMLNPFELHPVPSDEEIRIVMVRTGAVRGKLTDAEGNALAGETVSIGRPGRPHRGDWGGSVQTKEGGTFEFAKVPPGDYLMTPDPSQIELKPDGPGVVAVKVRPGETAEVKLVRPPAAPK